MIKVINAVRNISWIFDEGKFQIKRWEQYMEQLLPGHIDIFIHDMEKTIRTGKFSFEKNYEPILNDVLVSVSKREDAIEAFQKATIGLEDKIVEIFGKAPNVTIILYLGLCNGAGWVMDLDDEQYIMLGIEKIIELDWCDVKSMYGLIYHEIGHIYQMQFGILLRDYTGIEKFLWQLFTEGIAMFFEQKLVEDMNFFHQNINGWLQWNEENKSAIKQDFNNDLATMTYDNQRYFGDWVRYNGKGDVGYYLGAQFVEWLNERYKFDEMICFEIETVKSEWEKYLLIS